MSKYIDAVERLKHNPSLLNNHSIQKDLYTIGVILHRFEMIENSKPSDALKHLEDLRKQISFANSDGCIFDDVYTNMIKATDSIKQYILKAQQQEKMFVAFSAIKSWLEEEEDDEEDEEL